MSNPEQRLRRTLGFIDATAIGLGAIIGAGVFVAISPAVDIAGSAALIALVIAGFVALFNSLSSAQLAAAYSESGGTYAYGRIVINDLTGFIAGWIFVIAAISADSAIALAFAAYLGIFLPSISPKLIVALIGITVTLFNYFGMSYSARVNTILVALKVGILALFIVFGAFYFNPSRLAPFSPRRVFNVFHAAAILFFAYTGYARIATLGEEVRDPARTIPRAILTALSVSALLYIGTLAIALGLIGASGISSSQSPLSTAMGATGVRTAVYVISLGAVIATFSVFLTDLMGISRVIFAMGRNKDLPYWFSTLHEKYGTPHRSVLASGLMVVILSVLLPLRNLVEAGSFGLLVYYGITNLAAFRLSDDKRRYHRAWAVAGFISCFGLAFFLPWKVVSLELLVVAVGIGYFIAVWHLGRKPWLRE